MTVYELDKQATPGPWSLIRYANEPHDDEFMGRISHNEDEVYRGPFSFSGLRNDANAQLLVHCRNHFLKALEALKAERDYHSEQKRIGRADQLNEVIKELENV